MKGARISPGAMGLGSGCRQPLPGSRYIFVTTGKNLSLRWFTFYFFADVSHPSRFYFEASGIGRRFGGTLRGGPEGSTSQGATL